MSISRNHIIPIFFLTLLAGFLRFKGIERPITADSAAMLLMHFSGTWDSLFLQYTDTNQRTLNIYLAKIFFYIFGETETVFRLPGFIAGMFAIPLTYLVGLKMTRSHLAAFLSALFLTLSTPHLFQTRVARGYSLTVFLALTLVFLAYKLLDKQNSRLWASLFVLTGFSMILTVPSNIHFLTAIGIFYFAVFFLN